MPRRKVTATDVEFVTDRDIAPRVVGMLERAEVVSKAAKYFEQYCRPTEGNEIPLHAPPISNLVSRR